MSDNTPQDPNEIPPDAVSEPKKGPEDDNALGSLLSRVSVRADEKRAEITDQIRTQEADRERKEREDTEKRRQELLRKREKAIKKRQTQMLNAPKIDGSGGEQKDAEPTQVPVADFDLTVKNSTPVWVWALLALVVLGAGGVVLSLQTDTAPPEPPPESTPQIAEKVVEEPPAEAAAAGAVADASGSPQATSDASSATPDGAQAAQMTDTHQDQATVKPLLPSAKKRPTSGSRKKTRKSSSKRKTAKSEDKAEPQKKKGSIGLKRGLFRSNIK